MHNPIDISPTYAEVDLGAIRSNFRLVKERAAPGRVMAVVKANAYGHGLKGIARVLAGIGVDYFGVSQVREGITIRNEGLSIPTLILGPLLPGEIAAALHYQLEITASSLENAQAISRAAQKQGDTARVHIKIDTGMGRLGFNHSRAIDSIIKILRLPHVKVVGIFTHFAVAVRTQFAREQVNRFFEVLFQLEKRQISIPLKHAANSGAILNLPEVTLDMVRSGIMLFGYFPSNMPVENMPLQPAMTFKSRVKQVKEVDAGTGISYGLTYTTKERTHIASIPVGYGDGYSRGLSNKAHVLIRENRYPVAGRVCMDWMMVDLGNKSDVEEGNEVVLFGRQGRSMIPIWELAELAETIPYEILCNISERVPKIYTDPYLSKTPFKDKPERKFSPYRAK